MHHVFEVEYSSEKLFPIVCCYDGVSDIGLSPFLEVEEGLDGEAIVLILIPVNDLLVQVEAEDLSTIGDSYKLLAHVSEVYLQSYHSLCQSFLFFADRVHLFHVLEEG